jgi:hypothetical protein
MEKDAKAFLFKLSPSNDAEKIKIDTEKFDIAIISNKSYGPIFDSNDIIASKSGNHNLVIVDKCNFMNSHNSSSICIKEFFQFL